MFRIKPVRNQTVSKVSKLPQNLNGPLNLPNPEGIKPKASSKPQASNLDIGPTKKNPKAGLLSTNTRNQPQVPHKKLPVSTNSKSGLAPKNGKLVFPENKVNTQNRTLIRFHRGVNRKFDQHEKEREKKNDLEQNQDHQVRTKDTNIQKGTPDFLQNNEVKVQPVKEDNKSKNTYQVKQKINGESLVQEKPSFTEQNPFEAKEEKIKVTVNNESQTVKTQIHKNLFTESVDHKKQSLSRKPNHRPNQNQNLQDITRIESQSLQIKASCDKQAKLQQEKAQQQQQQHNRLLERIKKRRETREKEKKRLQERQQSRAQSLQKAQEFLESHQGSNSGLGGMFKLNDQLMHFEMAESVMELQIDKLLKSTALFRQFPNADEILLQVQELDRINQSYQLVRDDEGNPLINGLKNYRVELFNRVGDLIVEAQKKGYSNPEFHIMEADRSTQLPEGKAMRGVPERQLQEFVKEIDNLEAGEECAICLGEIAVGAKAYELECRHMFHEKCIFEWVKNSANCPNCRFNIKFGRGR